jgi:hypothetical protein
MNNDKNENNKNGILYYLNLFINIFTIGIIIYFIYTTIYEYINYKEFDKENVTKSTDLDIIGKKYKNCDMYKLYNTMSEEDKEYLYHIINYSRIKYKETKPEFQKKLKSIKGSLFGNMLISIILKNNINSGFNALKHNTLLTMIS